MMTYEEREATDDGERDAREEACEVCIDIRATCLRCQSLPPSPPERGHGRRCICGAVLRRAPDGFYCNGCGSIFPDRRVAQR